MSAIVIGCGRSGTNAVIEILSGSSALNTEPSRVNSKIAKQGPHAENYAAKCDTWDLTPTDIGRVMLDNLHMKVIWTIRHPRDMVLSKIRRGQPLRSDDIIQNPNNTGLSDDASPEGCLKDLTHMLQCYEFVERNFPDRLLLVKMESLLLNPKEETVRICDFLGITNEDGMWNFPSRMRNEAKKKRYGDQIDKSQVDLWKRWKDVYNGFFLEEDIQKKYNIEELFEDVAVVERKFGYEN